MDKESKKVLSTIIKNFSDKSQEEISIKELLNVAKKKTKKKLHKVEPITDLKDMLNKSYEKYKDNVAFKYKVGKDQIKTVTYKEFIDDVNGLGTQLIKMGLLGKRIAVISENRYEWAVAYLATACGVGVVVPLDKSLPANEIESLIIRSGAEAIFYSKKYNEIMQDIKQRKTTDLRYYVSMDLTERNEGVLSEREFIEKGKKLIEEGDRKFLDAEVDREGMTFMLFTSGTTAMSKAVMLSHKNICANIMDIAAVIKLYPDDVLLSFLPIHHTFECTVGFLYGIYSGAAIAYCEGVKHIANNIKEFEITAMISVPALYEGIYKRVMKSIEKKGKTQEVEMMSKLTSILSKVGLDFKKMVFKEIHEQFGGKLRLLVSGAAALDYKVEKGFNDLGFKMVQGYGLTETSPVLAAGNDFEQRIGSVGKVLPNVKIKILNKDEDGVGEIYVKAPYVMLGYYQNEEATKEVLDKEWFKTGDLGYIDKKGFLFICGRSKSVIVLKNGKNVFPEEIENIINRIEGVKESFVFGRPEPDDEIDLKLGAKIVYDKDAMKDAYGIETEEEIKEKVWEKIKELNKTMPPYKYIKEVIVTEEELIKTTTQKIKRFEEMKKI